MTLQNIRCLSVVHMSDVCIDGCSDIVRVNTQTDIIELVVSHADSTGLFGAEIAGIH